MSSGHAGETSVSEKRSEDPTGKGQKYNHLGDNPPPADSDRHVEEEEQNEEYPHGTKLFALTTALMLATFMVALDTNVIGKSTSLGAKHLANPDTLSDKRRRYCYSKNDIPVQKHQCKSHAWCLVL